MKVAITGTRSKIGSALAEKYHSLGYEVLHLNKTLGYDIRNTDQIIGAIKDCDVFVNCIHQEYYQSILLKDAWQQWQNNHNKLIISIGSLLTIDFIENIKEDKQEYYRQKLDLETTHRKLLLSNPYPKLCLVRIGEVYIDQSWDKCADFIVESLTNSKDDLYLFELAIGK